MILEFRKKETFSTHNLKLFISRLGPSVFLARLKILFRINHSQFFDQHTLPPFQEGQESSPPKMLDTQPQYQQAPQTDLAALAESSQDSPSHTIEAKQHHSLQNLQTSASAFALSPKMFANILGAMAAFSIISCGIPVMLATVIAIPLGIAMILVTVTSIIAAIAIMMPIFILGGLISATAVCLGTAMLSVLALHY
ncbi:hypothetical protein V8F06_013203 [Rhypophila decipiens]